MPRLRAKVDLNQSQIVKDLRKMGYSVLHLHTLGKGSPDIAVGAMTKHGKFNFFFEIKNPDKPPSARKLTPDEKEFHDSWKGQVNTVTSIDEIIKLMTA